ncbi:hypothetical protein VA599_18510 [Chromobacterium sp. TRC.1.1.SA]|uniref:Galactosyltransferase C-terminal domain-containing protein n=1 Tax=Chromobacterium indicum TaxID=3110228 RepID=A0ABV0CNK6_9NEIS
MRSMIPQTVSPDTIFPMETWLDMLRAIFPPQGVMVVGAGMGSSPWVQWLHNRGIESVTLIEGDQQQFACLQHRQAGNSSWMLQQAVVAGADHQTVFYQASHASENGLLAPETLQSLWPNLTTVKHTAVSSATTLDSLHAASGKPNNWLVLDCLPAADLLQGGNTLLPVLDVVIARVTTRPDGPVEASLAALSAQLGQAGLHQVCCQPERHPDLASAWFVRSSIALRETSQHQQQEITRLQHALQHSQSTQETEHHAMKRQAAADQSQIDELQIQITQLSQQTETLRHEKQAAQLQYQALSASLNTALQDTVTRLQSLDERQRHFHDGLVQLGADIGQLGQTVAATQTVPIITPRDIVMLIPSCKKNSDKAAAIRKTWGRDALNSGFQCYFLIGDPELAAPKLNGDTLHLPCRDDYESLLLKLTLAYQYICENDAVFKFIFKIDDDCYLNVDAFTCNILPQLKSNDYMGGAVHPKGAKFNNQWHFGKCHDEKFEKAYAFDQAMQSFAKGGYGYFLSKQAAQIIASHVSDFRAELEQFVYGFEDMRVSSILAKHHIVPLQLANYTVAKIESYRISRPLLVFDIQDGESIKAIHNESTAPSSQ